MPAIVPVVHGTSNPFGGRSFLASRGRVASASAEGGVFCCLMSSRVISMAALHVGRRKGRGKPRGLPFGLFFEFVAHFQKRR